jgi:hypothetical protein
LEQSQVEQEILLLQVLHKETQEEAELIRSLQLVEEVGVAEPLKLVIMEVLLLLLVVMALVIL